jgi:hypothetical protein
MFTSRGSRPALLCVLCSLAILAVAAPGASAAAQRYASPSGGGSACSSAVPCALTDAIEGAAGGDEVIVTPGDYQVANIEQLSPVAVHGVAGQPRPRLHFNGGGWMLLNDSALRWVEIDQAAPASKALSSWHGTVDQVIVRGGSAADCAAVVDSTMRNSVVEARSADGSAICTAAFNSTDTSTYRNVTAIAHKGIAIEAEAIDSTANLHVNVINTIARADAGGLGLYIRSSAPGGHATATVSHSNYPNYLTSGADAAYVDGGGNQGSAPLFANAAAGDYRQKPSSPTVDAGHYTVVNGPLDLDANPRSVGPTDIGAYELVPAPSAATGAATAVSDRSATLTGNVSPKGAPTTYRFEYGTTTAYGGTTGQVDAGSGTNDIAASTAVGALQPGTTYHFRLVASNQTGTATGGDQTFHTAAMGSGPSSPGDAFAGVRLISTRLALAGRFITLRLSCPAATAGGCTGRTRLTARHRRPGSRAAVSVALGRASFSIEPGRTARVRVRVTRGGRRLFAHARRLRGRAANAAHSGAGESRTTVSGVTIRRRSAPSR